MLPWAPKLSNRTHRKRSSPFGKAVTQSPNKKPYSWCKRRRIREAQPTPPHPPGGTSHTHSLSPPPLADAATAPTQLPFSEISPPPPSTSVAPLSRVRAYPMARLHWLEAILPLGIIGGMLCIMGNAQYFIHKAAHGRVRRLRLPSPSPRAPSLSLSLSIHPTPC